MLERIKIFDDFYSMLDFENMVYHSNTMKYETTHQPKMIPYPNRMKAMPCYETLIEDNIIRKTFIKTFESLTGLQIEKIATFFRKTLGKEIKESSFYKAGCPPHVDDSNLFDIAGLVYLNTYDINDGTKMFTYKEQYEPDIIVGSKPNRMIYYKADILHSANYNLNIDERIIQPFFIKLKGGNN